MSDPLVYTRTLAGGGTITVQFDLDWLSAPIDDCMFVRDLYDYFKAGPAVEQPTPAPVVNEVSTPVRPRPATKTAAAKPSPVEIQAVVTRAVADGAHVQQALRKRFKVSGATAREWAERYGGDGVAKPPPTAATPPVATPRSKLARAANPTPCPEPGCTKVCADGTGLAAHMRIVHGPGQAKRRPAAAPVAEPKLPDSTAPIDWDTRPPAPRIDPEPPVVKVYRCECGHELVSENELAKHTRSQHGRPPRATEQTRVSSAA